MIVIIFLEKFILIINLTSMMLPHENPVIHKLGKSILKKSVKYSNQIISSVNLI